MTWRRVDPFFARRIQLALFAVAIGFGADYLFTPTGSSAALTTIERTWLPLWAWGAIIMAAGIAGFIVEWRVLGKSTPLIPTPDRWRWGWISNTAHSVLFAVFIVLAGSSMFDLIHRALSEGKGWYGWRTTLMWGLFAFANLQYVRRLGSSLVVQK